MRRIKSAPANLASMSNKKKGSISLLTKKNIMTIPINKKNTADNKMKKVNEIKNNISFNSNLINDIVNDTNNLSIEESTIIFTIINFVANNILKREKLEEIYNYLLQAILRYFIMFFIHSQILNEKINIPLIDNNCLNMISNNILN